MINDLDIVQWAYLLDPCFQLVNTAGKPLTEGYIEVYYHGTRTKYYCASDFDGTLHPFQIPLDSLGSNIVLASPDYAYDVYVYNKFGSLVMSRYNVTPGLGGGGGGIPGSDLPEHWLGTDGEAINIASDAVNVCLPLPVSGSVDYEGEFVDHYDDTTLYLNEGMYIVEAVIQFRQSPWDLHNSLNNLKIDTGNGDSSYYWQEDVSGPESNQNVHERKVTFIRKVTGDEPYPFYISPSVGVQLNDVKIRRLNIVKLSAGGTGGGSQPMYKPGPGIAVDDEGVISVTGMQPVSGMNEYVTNITYNNDVTEIFNEIHNVTGDITNIYNELQTVTGDVHEYTAGSGIIIEDDVISIDPSYIPSATGDVSEEELQAVTSILNDKIDAVSAAVPEAQVNADWNATEGKAEILNKPDLSGYATKDEVQTATGMVQDEIVAVSSAVSAIISSDIQSDWDEDDTSDPAYIKNKPEEIPLVAGENIYIERVNDTLVISASSVDLSPYATNVDLAGATAQLESEIQTVSSAIPDVSEFATRTEVNTVSSTLDAKIDAVSADIPDSEEVEFEELDVDALVTDNELASATSVIENTIESVSAAIPDVSDLATKDEVQALADDVQTVSSAIPDISDLATKDEVNTVAEFLEQDIQTVSAAIPELPQEEDVEFEELDLSDYASIASVTAVEAEVEAVAADVQTVSSAIPDVSNLATKAELQTATGNLDDKIDTVSGAIVHYQGASGVAIDGDTVSLDEPLMIEAGNGITFTAEGDTITISADVPTVTGYVTESELATATGVLENDIQTVSSAIPELPEEEEVEFEELDLSGYASVASVTAVAADVQTVSSAIPDISNLATEEDLQTVSAAIPDVSEFATNVEVETVSGTLDAKIDTVSASIPDAQVNADWNAVSGKAEILNKPDSTTLVAGSGISIVDAGTSLIISATGSAGPAVEFVGASGVAVSGDTITLDEPLMIEAGSGIVFTQEGDSIIISSTGGGAGDVTKADLATVSGQLESDIQTVSSAIPDVSGLATKIEVQAVSAAIPEYTGASGIVIDDDTVALDDPIGIVAGQGITFTEDGDDIIISADVPTVTGFATEQELQAVSTAKQNVLTGITDVQVVQSLPVSPVATVLYLIPEV